MAEKHQTHWTDEAVALQVLDDILRGHQSLYDSQPHGGKRANQGITKGIKIHQRGTLNPVENITAINCFVVEIYQSGQTTGLTFVPSSISENPAAISTQHGILRLQLGSKLSYEHHSKVAISCNAIKAIHLMPFPVCLSAGASSTRATCAPSVA